MNTPCLDDYGPIVGSERVAVLRRLASHLKGLKVVQVNSTKVGGGVAEMLARIIPLMNELGVENRWEVIEGPPEFYDVTKTLHNTLQGKKFDLTEKMRDDYMQANMEAARKLNLDADIVIIHDPQPAALRQLVKSKASWIWRCHIDVARPHRSVWNFMREMVGPYDASVFSMAAFAQNLPHQQYLIAPSIDPLAPKNEEMEEDEIDAVLKRFDLDRSRPLIVQVSRFDRFKDPVGVIKAYKMVQKRDDCQLVLVGGGADDDPEGAEVLREVEELAGDDPDIRVLNLSPDSHREINAFQRAATIVVQKSTKEGFGLTVTEGLWKGRPVIGGAAGGIALQIFDHQTGFLVHSVEGLAYRLRYLLNRKNLSAEMGRKGRELVRHHFLLTRHIRDWLSLFLAVTGKTPA
jgi:trehalose synthase